MKSYIQKNVFKSQCYQPGLIIFISMFIVSCSSEKTPNNENFVRAINKHLHKTKVCFQDPEFVFPRTVVLDSEDKKKLSEKLDALHSAKLLSRVKSKKKAQSKDITLKYVNAFSYEVTGTGYKYSEKIGKKGRKYQLKFCYARAHAAAIEHFTKPKKVHDQTISNVSYKYSITKLAPWAKIKAIQKQFPQVKQKIDMMKTPPTQQAILHLTKERWEYSPEKK